MDIEDSSSSPMISPRIKKGRSTTVGPVNGLQPPNEFSLFENTVLYPLLFSHDGGVKGDQVRVNPDNVNYNLNLSGTNRDPEGQILGHVFDKLNSRLERSRSREKNDNKRLALRDWNIRLLNEAQPINRIDNELSVTRREIKRVKTQIREMKESMDKKKKEIEEWNSKKEEGLLTKEELENPPEGMQFIEDDRLSKMEEEGSEFSDDKKIDETTGKVIEPDEDSIEVDGEEDDLLTRLRKPENVAKLLEDPSAEIWEEIMKPKKEKKKEVKRTGSPPIKGNRDSGVSSSVATILSSELMEADLADAHKVAGACRDDDGNLLDAPLSPTEQRLRDRSKPIKSRLADKRNYHQKRQLQVLLGKNLLEKKTQMVGIEGDHDDEGFHSDDNPEYQTSSELEETDEVIKERDLHRRMFLNRRGHYTQGSGKLKNYFPWSKENSTLKHKVKKSVRDSDDIHLYVVKAAQHLGLLPPSTHKTQCFDGPAHQNTVFYAYRMAQIRRLCTRKDHEKKFRVCSIFEVVENRFLAQVLLNLLLLVIILLKLLLLQVLLFLSKTYIN